MRESERWKKKLVKGARKALEMSQDAEAELELHAGEHCGFCSAQAVCTEYTRYINENAAMDFADDPALLVPEVVDQRDEITTTLPDKQIARILTHSKEIERFLSNVKEYAINRYEQGNPIPGWKVVETKPRRRWEGENTEVATKLKKLGVKDPWERKLRGLGSIEREIREVAGVTAKKAKDMIQSLCGMTTPSKTLAPEEDERPGIDGTENAKRDFDALEIDHFEVETVE